MEAFMKEMRGLWWSFYGKERLTIIIEGLTTFGPSLGQLTNDETGIVNGENGVLTESNKTVNGGEGGVRNMWEETAEGVLWRETTVEREGCSSKMFVAAVPKRYNNQLYFKM